MKKTILITGCSSGIGSYCARALREDGWRVFATARKQADIAALKADGFETFYLDYRESASIAKLVDDVLEVSGGTLDALFNNGGYAQPGAVEDVPMAALREQFEANFFGWVDLTQRVIPIMRAQGHGRIIMNSSILGLVPHRWRGAYIASKYAIEGLTTTLYLELHGSNIHVSLIEPGPIRSQIAANAAIMADKYLDVSKSVHKNDLEKRLQSLKSDEKQAVHDGPEAVYKVLKHALVAKYPRAHYFVTKQTKFGVILKRVLPSKWLYSLMRRLS